MLDLFIGNRNYSSWSMRIGVLLRAFDISYKETLLPFGTDGIGEGSRFKEQSLAISRDWYRTNFTRQRLFDCLR